MTLRECDARREPLSRPTRAIAASALLIAAFAALVGSGCAARSAQRATPAVAARRSPRGGAAGAAPVPLDVSGFAGAVVVAPSGDAPRPVLIAAHGAGGTAEDTCAFWGEVVAQRGFVVCLRGTAMNPRRDSYFYRDHFALERELLATLDALHGRFPSASRGRYAYAGFSQGATMGALVAMRQPALLVRLILIEGGSKDWSVAAAGELRGAGGRVLFVCGTADCARGAERSLRWLKRAGAGARLEHVVGAGHTDRGELGERVRAAFGWVVQGDERWRAP